LGTRNVDGKTVTRLLSPDRRNRYQDGFENDRKLKHLASRPEALSLDVITEAEGWERPPSDET
jgi:hypothetical protein